MDTALIFLSGAAGAAIIKLIDNVIQWLLSRSAKREDKTGEAADQRKQELDEWRAAIDTQTRALANGQRCILLDRIQYLGRSYIRDGTVDFDDRRRLHQMHDAYHALGGNGDLNKLMEDVDSLRLTR